MARKCNFCGETESNDRRLFADLDNKAFICEYCVNAAYNMICGDTSLQ